MFVNPTLALIIDNLNLLGCGIVLVAIFYSLYVLVDTYYKNLVASWCMNFQKFCFKHQVGVFVFSSLINFFILVNFSLSISEAIIGLMTMFYSFLALLFLKKNGVPFISFVMVMSLFYRVHTHLFSVWYFALLIALIHVYYIILENNDSSRVKKIVVQLKKDNKTTITHLLEELFYFSVLEELVFIGFVLVYLYPWLLSDIPALYILIMQNYLIAGFISCIVARNVIIFLFNPGSSVEFKAIGFSLSAITLIFGVAVHQQGEYKRALSGEVDPGKKSRDIQIKQNGWSAEKVPALKLGQMHDICYPGQLPPMDANKELDMDATLAKMDNEKDPKVLRRMKFVNFVPNPIQEVGPENVGKSPEPTPSVEQSKPPVVKSKAPSFWQIKTGFAAIDSKLKYPEAAVQKEVTEEETVESVTKSLESHGIKAIKPTKAQLAQMEKSSDLFLKETDVSTKTAVAGGKSAEEKPLIQLFWKGKLLGSIKDVPSGSSGQTPPPESSSPGKKK